MIAVAKIKNTTTTFLGFGLASINIANGVTGGGDLHENVLCRFEVVCHVTAQYQSSGCLQRILDSEFQAQLYGGQCRFG